MASLSTRLRVELLDGCLNQFSMDEYEDSFRVVTTYEDYEGNGRTTRYNAVYVMDAEYLNMTGTLEGIAPNENVFAARFMGERLYLVTFERVDPFFVIDLVIWFSKSAWRAKDSWIFKLFASVW